MLVALCVLSCSARGDRPLPADPGSSTETASSTGQAHSSGQEIAQDEDAGAILSEVAARELLTRRFRGMGYRIRNDVRIRQAGPPALDFTVDGYDPEAHVGYEYIDPDEVGSDLVASEREAIDRDRALHILIVDAAPRAVVVERTDEFLRRLTQLRAP